MKKTFQAIVIMILMVTMMLSAITIVTASPNLATVSGVGSSNTLILNGQQQSFPAVNIDGRNYLKLRDVAMLLNGTQKQFSIDYNSKTNTVTLASGKAYTPMGDELSESITGQADATTTSQKFVYDDKEVSLTSYSINDRNYLQLRDLAKLLDFLILWDSALDMVMVNTYSPYIEVNYIDCVVTTYDEFMKAINSKVDNENDRKNIIIRGNIRTPENDMISFPRATITIDEGYTLTVMRGLTLGLNGNYAGMLNVKGALHVNEGAFLDVGDSGMLNVIGKGNIIFEKDSSLGLYGTQYGYGGKINGLPNAPSVYGSYQWNGSKFIANNELFEPDLNVAPNLKSTVKPLFEVKAELDYSIELSYDKEFIHYGIDGILLFSEEPVKKIYGNELHTYVFPLGTKIAFECKGRLDSIMAVSESTVYKPWDERIQYGDYYENEEDNTYEFELTREMMEDPNGIRIYPASTGGIITIIIQE